MKDFRTYKDTKIHRVVAVKLSLLIELGIAKDSDPHEEDWVDCNVDTFVAAFKESTGKTPVFPCRPAPDCSAWHRAYGHCTCPFTN